MKNIKTIFILIFAVQFWALTSCKKDDSTNPILLPELTTAEISGLVHNGATCGGNIKSDGGATVSARGVCWSKNQNPTINDSKTTDGQGTGSFTSTISGLELNTVYYVRAYATNSAGTAYGNSVTFTTQTTNPNLPVLTTSVIGNITKNSASSGGNITSDGGKTITARGICWGTSSNPTITANKTTDGSGSGTFISSITGLNPNTTYFVRAYATNSEGTSYGHELSFKTKEENLMNLTGAYLGQTPPGNTIKRFAPNNHFLAGASTWWWHGAPVFSPDGNLMLFVKYMADHSGTEVWFTEVSEGKWTIPQKFSVIPGKANNPQFLGKDTLVYMGFTTSATGVAPGGLNMIVRTSNGWSSPVKLNIPIPSNYSSGWGFTISKNKNVYISFETQNNPHDIFISKYINGQYQSPVTITELNSSDTDFAEYIDPNEEFIILSSKRSGGLGYHDMYISRKKSDGTWGTPISLGSVINANFEDVAGKITPDGKYFFFNTARSANSDQSYNAYWIDASVVRNIK